MLSVKINRIFNSTDYYERNSSTICRRHHPQESCENLLHQLPNILKYFYLHHEVYWLLPAPKITETKSQYTWKCPIPHSNNKSIPILFISLIYQPCLLLWQNCLVFGSKSVKLEPVAIWCMLQTRNNCLLKMKRTRLDYRLNVWQLKLQIPLLWSTIFCHLNWMIIGV